ncbi:RHS repeat-associated core domain-containing protein, partial [Butyrivibrio sp. M55]|uniref:RHS repeat-associated core domain-containing protein n=1 Tax=Butyrivibrio sp. M55 TaxID=1855323 RepID=UPI0008E661C3
NVTAEYLGDVRVRSYTYDALNRVIEETDALDHKTCLRYDAAGNVTEVTDALGNVSKREYDILNRVTKETDALGNEVSYKYTKMDLIDSITDAAGRVRKFTYTDGKRLTSVSLCGVIEQELIYDEAGRVKTRKFADGYEINYGYDALSRVNKVTGSDGRCVEYEYDALGRATKVIDGNSTTLYTYTATGRLKSVIDALGNETAYTYDALDNLKSIHRTEGLVSDEEKSGDVFPTVGKDGRVTIYSYDLSGQLTEVTDALGQKETYEYDQHGRLKTKTDRDNYATTYEYNNAGAVTKVGYADGRSVAFSYNELNQLSQINDWYGKTILENDILGRLTKVTDFKNRTVAYEYGATGERTKLVYPDGREVTYNYDEKLQLSSIIGNGEETRYTYDDLGRLSSKTFANGVSQAYTYMPGGNIASMTSTDKQGVLDKYFYSYNNAGLISGIDRNRRGLDKVSGRYEYSYDAIGRLTKTTHDGITKAAYEYDAFGNRTSMSETETKTSYTYDVLDRLVEAKELNNSKAIFKTYDYDKRGNQTKEFIDGLLQKTFTFDATNMLSKVVDKDKGELENHYNGLGFRVESTRPEEKIEYLCDLSKDYYNLLERTVNGETESFVYDNNVISMSKSGNNFYYLQDELGSPMYMTGTDGMVVSSYAFDDFGRNIDPFTGKRRDKNQKHAYTTNGNIIQPFAFTGYQEDEVSGLKFAQARFYSAENGRFLGEDQIKGFIDSPESQNHFEYCRQNPIEYIDIDGKCPLLATAAIGAGIGAVIGGGATIASSLVKGEKINWKNVGKNAAIGAGAGFAIGGGIGLVSMLAEATVVSSTAASIMANCGRIVATASATIEAGRQIYSDENIDMFKVTSAGAAGAVSGMVTGSPIGYWGAGFMNAGISAVQSITNDIHDGKGGLEIAIDAGVYATIGFVGGLFGGSGAMNNMTHSAHITNVLFGMEQSHLSITGRLIVGRAAEDYLKRAIVMGIVKGIGWTLGVTVSEKVYKKCAGE